ILQSLRVCGVSCKIGSSVRVGCTQYTVRPGRCHTPHMEATGIMPTTSLGKWGNGNDAASQLGLPACADRELSTITLPTSMGDCHLTRPYKPRREVVTTHVFTVPPQEAAPVRLWLPKRSSTGQRPHGKARAPAATGCDERAKSAPPHRDKRGCSPIWRGHPSCSQREASSPTSSRKSRSPAYHTRSTTTTPAKRQRPATSVLEAEQRLGSEQYWHSSLRGLHTAPPVPTTSRWLSACGEEDGDTVANGGAGLFIKSEDMNYQRPLGAPVKQPRAMSASARGLAIRHAVDGCCKNLPATPRYVPGATRLLQQWDRATRHQRDELLTALADQLLVNSDETSCPQQHACSHSGADYESGIRLEKEVRVGYMEQQTAIALRCPFRSEKDVDKNKRRGLPPSTRQVGLPPPTKPKGDGVPGEAIPRPQRPSPQANIDFLGLLGPHASLLATRLSSHLQTSFAYGHELGPCLRVVTLLSESATGGITVQGCFDPCLLGQQLCTPGLINTALQVAVSHQKSAANSQILATEAERKVRRRRRRQRGKISPTVPPHSFSPEEGTDEDEERDEEKEEEKEEEKGEENEEDKEEREEEEKEDEDEVEAEEEQEEEEEKELEEKELEEKEEEEEGEEEKEEETNRAKALDLLVALVRAGGKRVKDYISYPYSSPSSLLGLSENSSPIVGDPLGLIVMELRRPECGSDTREAGRHLLVELGLGGHDSAGIAKVWSAVLCLLDGRDKQDPAGAQILGFRVAQELLVRRLSEQRRRNETLRYRGDNLGSDVLDGALPSPQKDRQRLMCPELTLMPSVLKLSLSPSYEVREAAAGLAVLLATGCPRPCCYLVVAGLAGLLGLVSEVERGAPIAWIQLQRERVTGTRLREETEEDAHSADEESASSSRGSDDTAESDGYDSPDGSPAPSTEEFDRRGAGFGGGEAILVLKLLRRVCTSGRGGNGEEELCLALAYALAPLAVLDLVVCPRNLAADRRPTDTRDAGNAPAGVEADGDAVVERHVTADRGEAGAGGDSDEESGECPRSERQAEAGGFPQKDNGNQLGGGELPSGFTPSDELVGIYAGGSGDVAIGRRFEQPPGEVCLAVADALLAMYAAAGATNAGHPRSQAEPPQGWPPPSSSTARDKSIGCPCPSRETLGLKGIIEEALGGCPILSRSVRDGDSEAMGRVFSQGGSDGDGANSRDKNIVVEFATLRANIGMLTKRLGRVRPPPPPPPPPPPAPPSSVPAGNGNSMTERCERPDAPQCDRLTARVIGRRAEKLLECGQDDSTPSETISDGVSGDSGDDWGPNYGRETNGSKVGALAPQRWMDLGPNGSTQRTSRMTPRHTTSTELLADKTLGISGRRPQHQRRRQRQQSGRPPRVAAGGCESGYGPRVWGPEDWGEDAPTMALLTEAPARSSKTPERQEGERPGPIWRAVFGG
ncbi:unnamed protein product, partial [Ectocarpus sp. 13 AM-2016]